MKCWGVASVCVRRAVRPSLGSGAAQAQTCWLQLAHPGVDSLFFCFPCRNVPHVSEVAAASAAPSPADFIVDAAGVPVSMAYCFAESGPYDEFFARAGTAAVCVPSTSWPSFGAPCCLIHRRDSIGVEVAASSRCPAATLSTAQCKRIPSLLA
jgi:hypothetical protein